MHTNYINSQKRPCQETESDLIVKKRKLDLPNVENNNKENLLLELNVQTGERTRNKKLNLVSLMSNDQKKNVIIYPGQIVWTRFERSPFWPSMVWSTKSGKITDENQRILVRLFAKTKSSVWIKLENVFPFDGLESYEKLKNSVNILLVTAPLRRDYEFAFNSTSEFWYRAVAEASYCMNKDRYERLALFISFSSPTKRHDVLKFGRARHTNRRRSRENSNESDFTATSTSSEEELKVSEEMTRVHSFIHEISFPVTQSAMSAASIEKIEQNEQMLLTFVRESLSISKFGTTDKACNICCFNESVEKLIKCTGTCDGYLHEKCFENCFPQRPIKGDDEGKPKNLICQDCNDQSKPFCFICKTDDSLQSDLITCSVQNCSRRYHIHCLKNWPQAKFCDINQDLTCPLHECHHCTSKPIRNDQQIVAELMTCIKCPTTLHSHGRCIHAGTIILSEKHHICIKHRQFRENIWHLDYCYICKTGSLLSHCSTCPHSFHESCLPFSTSTNTSCAECLNGQDPIYGDIVWAKLYTYPWWPAVIVPPHCVPPNMQTDKHSPHAVCVCFFGDYDYSWIDRESVHRFDEDNFALFTQNTVKFNEAILSAKQWFKQFKLIRSRKEKESTYLDILENIPIAPATLFFDENNEASVCKCDVNGDDPCGPSSSCVNRVSCTECNDSCPSAAKCGNKCIQQRKYAKVNLKYLGKKGFGLISAEYIPKGSIVYEYVGEVITKSEFERRNEDKMRKNVYFMKYQKDLFIDAETKGNWARFINHSCNPNCSFEMWSANRVNVVAVVALKEIPKYTEITCKYYWSRNIPCLCNEDNCSGFC